MSRLSIALLVCVWLAAGCEAPVRFAGTDVSGAAYDGRFALADHTGRRVTLNDFRGKAVVVFFGYTHCPDVCPTALAEAAAAMRLLGEDATRVQVLFISVDPERDTQDLLKAYVPAFHPSFLGLRGSAEEIDVAARSFRVFHRRQPEGATDRYSIDHSTGMFVFDPGGRIRLYFGPGKGAGALAEDIRTLLRLAR